MMLKSGHTAAEATQRAASPLSTGSESVDAASNSPQSASADVDFCRHSAIPCLSHCKVFCKDWQTRGLPVTICLPGSDTEP
jgi:hypothetical protein